MLVTHQDYKSDSKDDYLKNVVEHLENTGFLKDKISLGESRYIVRLQVLSNCNKKNYYFLFI